MLVKELLLMRQESIKHALYVDESLPSVESISQFLLSADKLYVRDVEVSLCFCCHEYKIDI